MRSQGLDIFNFAVTHCSQAPLTKRISTGESFVEYLTKQSSFWENTGVETSLVVHFFLTGIVVPFGTGRTFGTDIAD